MITINNRGIKLRTSLSLLLLIFPLTTFYLWIHAFNQGTNQRERVDLYQSYLPFLNLTGITILSMVCCVGAIILSALCLKLNNMGWRILNILIILVSSLKLLLTLWGLM